MSGYSGSAEAIGHAGEILQGELNGEAFLVTLPAPGLRSRAIAQRSCGWTIDPPTKLKALRAAQLAASGPFNIRIDSTIPVGCGYGSSTADCVAAVRSLANLAAAQIAKIVHQAEGATDSTMYGEQPVVFLPRLGQLLKPLAGVWPHAHVTVIDLGGEVVDTLATPLPTYTGQELQAFVDLLALLEAGFANGDLQQIAQVASASARIHQAHRPHPDWQDAHNALTAAGSLGVARAHSGSLIAALSPYALDIKADYRYELGVPSPCPSSL